MSSASTSASPRGGGQVGIDERDHHPRGPHQRAREVGDHAECVAPVRQRPDLHERDVHVQAVRTQQGRHAADVTGDDLRQCRDAPAGAGTVQRAEVEAVDQLWAQRGRLGEAEQQHGPAQFRALGDQGLGQGQRLARALRPGDDVARSDMVCEAQL
jgi:hypothetical protein